MTPADAVIPKANLSITKLVANTSPGEFMVAESDFIPGLGYTTGHYEFTDDGLHVWTESTSQKAAQYWPASGGLPDAVTLDWTGTPIQPGSQVFFDVDGTRGNGNDFNMLVGETVYGNEFWYTGGTTRAALRGFTCPSTTGGFGSDCHGTLAQFQAAIPAAEVLAIGYSLGSGAVGDGVISGLTVDDTTYTFGGYASSMQAAPGDTVQYQLTVSNVGGALAAQNVQVTDVLPAELTLVPGSLVDNGNGCSFAGQVLTCNAGTFPVGITSKITFQATLDGTISSAGLPLSEGHWVDVQKQEQFADMSAGFDGSFSVDCPAGSIASDGGLLLDAVDPGGFFSDVVVKASERVPGSPESWRVKVTNLGDERAQGKVMVTCLGTTVGSSSGHTHDIVTTQTGGVNGVTTGSASGPGGTTVTRTCPVGTTPIAPSHEFDAGVGVVRESYANGRDWVWVVDHGAGTSGWFGATCLGSETTEDSGHQATLVLAVPDDTITVGEDSTSEGVITCPDNGHAITGGFAGYDAAVLSLGKQPRGTNYMFRFSNDDWENAHDADIQVTCVGVRTTAEPTYYHVVNTASVSTTTNNKNSATTVSSADVAVDGDPLAPPPAGVQVAPTAGRSFTGTGKTKSVDLTVSCAAACSFTVKVIEDGDVVAKMTTSLAAGNNQLLKVPTTNAGKNLGAVLVSVKVKTTDGTSTYPVNITS